MKNSLTPAGIEPATFRGYCLIKPIVNLSDVNRWTLTLMNFVWLVGECEVLEENPFQVTLTCIHTQPLRILCVRAYAWQNAVIHYLPPILYDIWYYCNLSRYHQLLMLCRKNVNSWCWLSFEILNRGGAWDLRRCFRLEWERFKILILSEGS